MLRQNVIDLHDVLLTYLLLQIICIYVISRKEVCQHSFIKCNELDNF